jgi:hypothetical protein
MARNRDSHAVRTSGMVLCLIGVLTLGAVQLWNSAGDYPPEATLQRVRGTVVLGQLMTIPTRTAIERWVVVDVDSEGQDTRWVFPGQTSDWGETVSALEVGSVVNARAQLKPERLRWSDMPVTVIWSLSMDAVDAPGSHADLISYAEVIAAERASRYQSPIVGWLMIGIGGAVMLGSRLRLGAGRDRATRA